MDAAVSDVSHTSSRSEPGCAPMVEAAEVLAALERFLLPPRDAASERLGRVEKGMTPAERLDAIVYQTTVADQIRLMQSYYRDSHDDYCLCEALRAPQTRVPGALPTKHLLQMVTEGRARAVALSKLVHGNASLQTVKATTELANVYAIQGLWEQAIAHAAKANERLEALAHQQSSMPQTQETNTLEMAHKAANEISAVMSLLRCHAIAHAGVIDASFVAQPGLLDVNAEEVIEVLREALSTFRDQSAMNGKHEATHDMNGDDTGNGHRDNSEDSSSSPSTRTVCSNTGEGEKIQFNNAALSWGSAVALLRQTKWMQHRIRTLVAWMLPSWLAALRLAFSAADQDRRALAHPHELTRCLKMYPLPLRAVSSTEVITALSQLQSRVEIPLRRPVSLNDALIDTVTYDLPVTWEEFLASYIHESSVSMTDVVRYELSTIMGICCTYTGRLMDAEAAFQDAIQLVDKMGIESDLLACDLYNSIAQLLLAKHKNVEECKKKRSHEIAVDWLNTEEGKSAVREYALKHPIGRGTPGTTARSADTSHMSILDHDNQKFSDIATRNAYQTLLQRHVKQVLRQEADASTGDLLAAYRYLMRSVDIQERQCDYMQPAIASAAISVASIEYVRGRYEEARDWLVQSIRAYEREQSAGARGVAFVQLQLSHVFQRLKRPAEAAAVLEAAVLFHASTARHKASVFQEVQYTVLEQDNSPSTDEQLNLGKMEREFQEEAATASQLQFRVANLYMDDEKFELASKTLEEAVEFTSSLFGWDSPEAADARREYAKLLLRVHDYSAAQEQLQRANEVYELVFGPNDHRAVQVLAELKKIHKR